MGRNQGGWARSRGRPVTTGESKDELSQMAPVAWKDRKEERCERKEWGVT